MLNSLPVVSWQFLQEPAWRWALFFIMIALFFASWREVVRHVG